MKVFFKKAPENIYEVFQPTYYLFKLFGLFPMTLNGTELTFTMRDIFWILIILFSYIYLLILNVMSLKENFEYLNSKVLEVIWKANFIYSLSINIIVFLYQVMKRSKIEEFIKMLSDFDKMVRELN